MISVMDSSATGFADGKITRVDHCSINMSGQYAKTDPENNKLILINEIDNTRNADKKFPTQILLRPIRFLLFLCGAYVPKKWLDIKWLLVLRIVFVATAFLLTIASIVMIIRSYHSVLINQASFNGTTTWLLCTGILSLEAQVSGSFLLWWQWKGSLRRVMSELRSATQERGIASRLVYHKVYVTVITVITLSTFAALISGTMLCDEHRRELVSHNSYLEYVTVFTFAFKAAWWLLANAVFAVVCHFIYAEVKFFNDEIQNASNLDQKITQNLIITHARLSSTLEKASSTFGFYVFIMLASNIPAIILLAYDILTTSSVKISVYMGFLLALSCFQLLSLTLSPSKIYDETAKTPQILYNKLANEAVWLDGQTFRIATWLTSQANSTLGLNAGGFFLITKSLILTAVSLIVSYLMLLIQLAPAAVPSQRNATTLSAAESN